jgi:chorismate mutase
MGCEFSQETAVESSGAKLCRGVRGATTVERNEREEILRATRQMLALIIRQNGIDKADVASAIFTTTPDLNAEFPALAARQLGWLDVALLCAHEMAIPGSLEKCIRVLIHWNTQRKPQEIKHVYLREAAALRPDLCSLPPVDWEELEAWIEQQLAAQHKAARGEEGSA